MVAFSAGAVLTAAQLNTAFNQQTINAQTGTSYTLTLTDQGGMITSSNSSTVTITIPLNATVAFANGTQIQVLNIGSGIVKVVAAAGASVSGYTVIPPNEMAFLTKQATNTWYMSVGARGAGSVIMIPTSVTAGASGSASVAANGEITMTATESVTINGVFTSAFSHYTLKANFTAITGAATDDTIYMAHTLSGSLSTGTPYFSVITYATTGGTTGFIANGTATYMICTGISNTYPNPIGEHDIFGTTSNASGRRALHRSGYTSNGGVTYATTGTSWMFSNSLAGVDGIRILKGSAGTLTGKIRIYGWNEGS